MFAREYSFCLYSVSEALKRFWMYITRQTVGLRLSKASIVFDQRSAKIAINNHIPAEVYYVRANNFFPLLRRCGNLKSLSRIRFPFRASNTSVYCLATSLPCWPEMCRAAAIVPSVARPPVADPIRHSARVQQCDTNAIVAASVWPPICNL